MALSFYANNNNSSIVENRRRRRMGARKQRRYMNSILLMQDRLAGDFSQSEVECEEEEFPDFNDQKDYFSSAGPVFRNAEENNDLNAKDKPDQKAKQPSEKAKELERMNGLRNRLSKNTRKLFVRSCSNSKFFNEMEAYLMAFKMKKLNQQVTEHEKPAGQPSASANISSSPHNGSITAQTTTFPTPKLVEGKVNVITIKGLDSFQRFLTHRMCEFHDLKSQSNHGEEGKVLRIRRPATVEKHHPFSIFGVHCSHIILYIVTR
ncbi:hypothetical protein AAMO2058_000696000 [Amorphochlora amoebiformis]